ncbi:MAG: phenylalanine--tRNA ligase subunit beta [Bacteroidota bacterium]|nr:phenylalanine--tRNA ligase subunit beta [Bacteroidota bacterium]
MKISYNWLKQFIKTSKTPNELSVLLTDLGLEVEGIEEFESVKGGLKGMVVGEVLSVSKHPNADKLNIAIVELGLEAPLQIVCGAPNIAAGQKVAVATIGTTLYDKDDNKFQIKKGKIRGEDSYGMICSEAELKLGNNNNGIMVLDNNAKPGTPLAELFNIENDAVFEIGLTPNRADAMSHWGVARDIKAGLQHLGISAELITPSVSNYKIDNHLFKMAIDVKDSKLCPRYCGVTMNGITVKESPQWLQNRLKAIGITPKNNVVDITNYVMHDIGQPLHAFDAVKIKGQNVIVKTATEGDKLTTLDGIERVLSAEDLCIYNKEKPMAIAGVMGGLDSGVSENTTSIFIESAYFDPVSVRKSAKRHAINSDASFRYERGIDPEITEYALKRAVILIKELAGGEVTSEITDYYPKKFNDATVFLNYETLNKIVGITIPPDIIKNILTSLKIKIISVSNVGLGLSIPPYRVDILREIDVIEEILRIYGYNNIGFDKKLNATIANTSRTDQYKIQNICSKLLVSNGFFEIMNNSLTTPTYNELIESIDNNNNVEIINPLSSELSIMRQSMLFGGLESISYNINRRKNNLKFFEFGKTYLKKDSQYIENKHLTLFLTGNNAPESWISNNQKFSFFDLKSYTELILLRLGINNFSLQSTTSALFSEGLDIIKEEKILVSLGIVKKSILKHFDIKQEVLFADFEWDNYIEFIEDTIKFREIPKFPEVRRDLALLLDTKVRFDDLQKVTLATNPKLIKKVDLFDVYQGDKLPENKKSYALSLILQDDDKTLTDDKIDQTIKRVVEALATNFDAVLR